MENDLYFFAEKLQRFLQPESEYHQRLVKKGLLLYRQHHVYTKRLSGHIISGKVQDVSSVDCILDLTDPLNCECSCPQEGICRHQMALFFSAYSDQASVFDWVQNWKSLDSPNDILSSVKRASSLLKTEKKKTDAPLDPDQWLLHFQHVFEEINGKNEYLLDITGMRTFKHLISFLPVEREWKPLYRLFAAYETFKHVNEICTKNEFEFSGSLFHYLIDEASEALIHLSSYSFPFAFDPFIDYLRNDCRKLLEAPTNYEYESTEFYRLLWSRLLKMSGWRRQEADRLREGIIHEIDEGGTLKTSEVIGFIHQAFLEADDETALHFLEHLFIDGIHLAIYMPHWISELKSLHAEKRMYRYLSFSITVIADSFQFAIGDGDHVSFMQLFFQSFDERLLAEQHPKLLERLYRVFLPYSFYKYDNFLYTTAKYREWVELQLLYGSGIESAENEKLGFITKHQPEMILPLYHQAVSQLIAGKNRMSYKKAVRYLKKLRTVYKKSNQISQWELFFTLLQNKTKRLRAFQEECRKGKLIDAD